MSKKVFLVKIKPDAVGAQGDEVSKWFSGMNRDSVPASIEYRSDGSREVDVVGLINSTGPTDEDDESLILHTIFERYKMRDADGGAFVSKSSVDDFEKFKSLFIVSEA